ncbi:MATE family efflux transporter [Dorea sp.]
MRLLFGKIEADVMYACDGYLLITTFSLPALAICDAGAALCRSIGKTNVTMYISVVTNVVNIAAIFRWDGSLLKKIMGIAMAPVYTTVIGQCMGARDIDAANYYFKKFIHLQVHSETDCGQQEM